MSPVECPFEAEVLSAVLQGRWPGNAGAELRAHVEGCLICSEVATVAAVLDGDRSHMRATAVLPSSGRVWWMAQMRARREAAAAANRTMDVAIGAVVICAMAAAWMLLPVSEWITAALSRIGWRDAAMIAAGLMAAIVIPAAACLAFSRD